MTGRIYLDNAATSWPKPESVYAAVDRYQRENGAPAGRGAYAEAQEAERLVDACRRRLAALLNAERPERIALAFNGTDALNIGIHGVLAAPGRDLAAVRPHAITSRAEHNSVLRPLRELEHHERLSLTIVDCDDQGRFDPAAVVGALRAETRLVALTHASNVTGAVQDIEPIGRSLAEHPALLLVDAAQTIGHEPVDVRRLGADLLAASGHKGLLGPLGTGLLYVGPRADGIAPWRRGGTGSQSESPLQPDALPTRLEAGNPNVPGLVGLEAALRTLEAEGVESRRDHERALVLRLLAGLESLPGVSVHGPRGGDRRTGVVSLNVAGYDPQELAALLDAGPRIQCRAGLHCAPLVHRSIGSEERGGTLRLSVGPFNSAEHIDLVLEVLADL